MTNTAPVHVLLDVDGVINAIRFGRPPSDGWERHEKYKHIFGRYAGEALTGLDVGAFPIRFSPDLVEALNALAGRPDVHFHWLTTWLDEARFGLSPRISLREGRSWPVLGAREKTMWQGSDTWWKLKAAQAHAAEHPDARIVWIDDDLADSPEAIAWSGEARPRLLLIAPEPTVGMTPGHIEAISAFIERNETPAG